MMENDGVNFCPKCQGRFPDSQVMVRGYCEPCYRMDGKLIELQIAIHQGDLGRVEDWPALRVLLRGSFGGELNNWELYERLEDWLKDTKGFDDQAALNLSIADVIGWLKEPIQRKKDAIEEQERVIESRKLLADGREPKFNDLVFEDERTYWEYREEPNRTEDDRVREYFERLDKLIRTATENSEPDYYEWFRPNGQSPLPRQERWNMLRGIREKDNATQTQYFETAFNWLSQAYKGISRAYEQADADVSRIEIPGVEPHTPVFVAHDLLKMVVAWHHADGGYWEQCCVFAETDGDVAIIREQLRASDSRYPIDKKTASILLDALRKQRSHCLRHCTTERPKPDDIEFVSALSICKYAAIRTDAMSKWIKTLPEDKKMKLKGQKTWKVDYVEAKRFWKLRDKQLPESSNDL